MLRQESQSGEDIMIGTELTEVRDPIELLVDTERYPLWDATDERVRLTLAR